MFVSPGQHTSSMVTKSACKTVLLTLASWAESTGGGAWRQPLPSVMPRCSLHLSGSSHHAALPLSLSPDSLMLEFVHIQWLFCPSLRSFECGQRRAHLCIDVFFPEAGAGFTCSRCSRLVFLLCYYQTVSWRNTSHRDPSRGWVMYGASSGLIVRTFKFESLFCHLLAVWFGVELLSTSEPQFLHLQDEPTLPNKIIVKIKWERVCQSVWKPL